MQKRTLCSYHWIVMNGMNGIVFEHHNGRISQTEKAIMVKLKKRKTNDAVVQETSAVKGGNKRKESKAGSSILKIKA